MLNQVLIKAFGLRVRQLRDQLAISQEELSFITGFHRTYIGMIERGERNISLANMAVFAKAFNMDLSELVDFSQVDKNLTYEKYESKVEQQQSDL